MKPELNFDVHYYFEPNFNSWYATSRLCSNCDNFYFVIMTVPSCSTTSRLCFGDRCEFASCY